MQESVEQYLERIIRLLRRKEMRRKADESNQKEESAGNEKPNWSQGGDPMDLDQTFVDKRKCFKCGKTEHIRRFCKKKTLVLLKTENEKIPVKKGNRKEEESL